MKTIAFVALISVALTAVSHAETTAENLPEKTAAMAVDRSFEAMLALFIVTAAMLFAEPRAPRWSLPRILYIIGLAVTVGLALRPRSLFLFLVIWTSQHWILATGLASAESPPSTWVPGLLALGFATGFIHYLLDRSVYRMLDPQVRAAASDLVGNAHREQRWHGRGIVLKSYWHPNPPVG
jgi:hypothetical protein